MPSPDSIKFFETIEPPKLPKEKTEKEIKARLDINRLENPDTIEISENSMESLGLDRETFESLKKIYPKEWLSKLSELAVLDENTKKIMIQQLLEKN